ncbi:hypothetical protein FACS189440_18920 [Bacteroidia bacterium]|nr:hypothetical protein FACS189440_18920 [Bacteroidia bacterium]
MKIAIIGSGAYGSYIANLLAEKHPTSEIHIYEVGDSSLKNENQIGYLSHILNAPYNALSKGRFFGYGGASVKWGGQLLTFSHNDFKNPSRFLYDIVELNEKYKNTVFSKFNLSNIGEEEHLTEQLFTKTGIWLSYFNRNLFKYFRIENEKRVTLFSNSRVTKLLLKDKLITGFEYIHKGDLKKAVGYDYYFLAAGAFEGGRILLNSQLTTNDYLSFSDHLSQKAFKIKSGTKMGKTDFSFDVKGASLITKRMIGEIDSTSFFAHPIFNSEFPFFQNLKKFMFGRHFSIQLIAEIIKDIPACIAFAWSMFIKKKLYVYKNEWYLQIDIENPIDSGKMSLSEDKDLFGENGLNIDLTVGKYTDELFVKAKEIVKEYLDKNQVEYEVVNEATNVEKYEDTYHPFGIYSDFTSIEDYFTKFSNMLITNTGVLPRAGGINSTCAVFPLIEEYVENYMK